MNAEEYIKSKLDGNFWYIDQETHKVLHRSVPKDYEPVFKPAYVYVPNNMAAHIKRRDWTADEDERLMAYRAARTPWHEIQKYMRRGITQLRARYEEICAERGYNILKGQPRAYTEWPEELKEQIRRLRFNNLSLKAIARKVCASPHNIRVFLEDCAPELMVQKDVNGNWS